MAELSQSNKDLKHIFEYVGSRISGRSGEHRLEQDAGRMEKKDGPAVFGKPKTASNSANFNFGDLDTLARVLVANEEAKNGKRGDEKAGQKLMTKAFDDILAAPEGAKEAFDKKLQDSLREYAAREAAGQVTDDPKGGMKLTDAVVTAMGARAEKLKDYRTEAAGNLETFAKAATLLGEEAVKPYAEKQADMLVAAMKDPTAIKALKAAVEEGDKEKAAAALEDMSKKAVTAALVNPKDFANIAMADTTKPADVSKLVGELAKKGGQIGIAS